ncbi:hypothetical protein UE98_19020 [Burkholderia cenocepacia]|nr:hypothetical protein UE98_19020 [Burkholderia cenocepacia]
MAEIAHFKDKRGVEFWSTDYTDEQIDDAIKIIRLHENMSQTIKQKDGLPLARVASDAQVSVTRTGKRKI